MHARVSPPACERRLPARTHLHGGHEGECIRDAIKVDVFLRHLRMERSVEEERSRVECEGGEKQSGVRRQWQEERPDCSPVSRRGLSALPHINQPVSAPHINQPVSAHDIYIRRATIFDHGKAACPFPPIHFLRTFVHHSPYRPLPPRHRPTQPFSQHHPFSPPPGHWLVRSCRQTRC